MKTIEIDAQVYDVLRREADFGETPNDALRRILKLVSKVDQKGVASNGIDAGAAASTLATHSYGGRGFSALAHISALGPAVVLKGSRARLREAGVVPPKVKEERDRLKAAGVLRTLQSAEGQFLEFVQNAPFQSKSLAAGVVSGGSVNGNTAWRPR